MASQATLSEYTVRAPKISRKKFNMMRFHTSLDVKFTDWTQAKLEKENNQKEFKSLEEEMPKFGAGSEFGREQREEARRKKYGINMRKYKPEDQPWLLGVGGKSGRKYKGIREGGVSDNSSWYVFMHGKDGAFEAYPVEEWYNFKQVQRYKCLSAEEAELEFERRDKVMNHFAMMYNKRLKKEEDPEGDAEEVGKKKGPSAKNLKLSEIEDWMSDGDDEEDDDEDKVKEEDENKPKKKKGPKSKGSFQKGGKKSKTFDDASDDDCLEEDDEFDEGNEQDYISSDSSDPEAIDDEKVRKELAGVEEEDALRKILNSDESESDENKEKEKEAEEQKEEEKEGEKEKKKKKKKKKEKKVAADSDAKSSDESDEDTGKKKKSKEGKRRDGAEENENIEGGKRKLKVSAGDIVSSKKPRTDPSTSGAAAVGASGSSDSGVTEETIRRYLMRKPMTTIELLQKFKSKKTGLNSDHLVNAIAQVLKRISLEKRTIKGKMYLSLKQ